MKAVLFDMDGVLADTESFYNRRRAAYLAKVLPSYDGPWDFAGSNDRAIWEAIVPDDPVLRERLHAGYDALSRGASGGLPCAGKPRCACGVCAA